MTKRRYHTTKVNQVNWAQIAEQAGDQPVVFAVDVAKAKFVAALMKPDRTVLKTIQWQHPEMVIWLWDGCEFRPSLGYLCQKGENHIVAVVSQRKTIGLKNHE